MNVTIPTGSLKGETLVYVKNGNQRTLLTTEEIVFTNSNLSYCILLDDIADISPFNIKEKELGFVNQSSSGEEVDNVYLQPNYFKIKANHVNVLSQGKSHDWGETEMIFKISPTISQHLINVRA